MSSSSRTGDAGVRVYHPRYGVWVQRDPIGYAGGSGNLYEYAASGPSAHTDPSGTDWRETAETCWYITTEGLHGFFVQGPTNIGTGLWNTGRETTLMAKDYFGMIISPIDYECESAAALALESGNVSLGTYYGTTVANIATVGVYGQGEALWQYSQGTITANECSARVGSAGIMQLGGAYCMHRQGGIYTRPIRQLPRDLAKAVRTRKLPKDWNLSDAAIQRVEKDPFLGPCLREARTTPIRYGHALIYESASGTGPEIIVRFSGHTPGIDSLPSGVIYPSGLGFTTCGMPKALSACRSPLFNVVSNGGIVIRGGTFFGFRTPARPQYFPPCGTCCRILNLNVNVGTATLPQLMGPLDVVPVTLPTTACPFLSNE